MNPAIRWAQRSNVGITARTGRRLGHGTRTERDSDGVRISSTSCFGYGSANGLGLGGNLDNVAHQALKIAIAQVADMPVCMETLAAIASTRRHCEMEWVRQLATAPALRDFDPQREVRLPDGGRADLSIRGTLIEFKSTKAGYATPDNFWTASSKTKDSSQIWFEKDIARSHAVDGMFVLLVSTTGPTDASDYSGLSATQVQRQGVARYLAGLKDLAEFHRSAAFVEEVNAGRFTRDGLEILHDAVIVSWPRN